MARHRDHPLNDRLRVERDRLEKAYEQRLADMYAEVLRAIGSDAARRFQRASWGKPIIAAGDWQPPHPDDIYPSDAADRINAAADPLRGEMWQDVVDGVNSSLGLALTVTNPLLAGSIGQLGRNITAVADSQRSDIMQVVQDAHDQGLSIRNTSRAILEHTSISSRTRAEAIARTELTAATNLGGLAAARLVSRGDMLKRWASASDAFVRPAHQEANAAYADDPIPVEHPFTVGGELLMAPGDPSGSAGNVVNCRCTTIYMQREPAPSPASGPGYTPPTAPAPQEPLPPITSLKQLRTGARAPGAVVEGKPIPKGTKPPGKAYRESKEEKAVGSYKGTAYKRMNSLLRNGHAPSETVRMIDSLMETATDPSVVYRSVGTLRKAEAWLGTVDESMIGKVIEDPGYMSTTTSAQTAQRFGSVRFNIRCPKGTKMFDMRRYDPYDALTEKEFVLARGSGLLVRGVKRYYDRVNRQEVAEIFCEVVKQGA